MNMSFQNNTINKYANDVITIVKCGLISVDSYSCIKNSFSFNYPILSISTKSLKKTIYNIKNYNRLIVTGAGKASAPMVKAIEEILGNYISNGHIIVKYGHSTTLKYVNCIEAGHPIPDSNGIKGTKKVINLLRSADRGDLVIFVLTGGASSLLVQPYRSVSLKDLQKFNRIIISCGAEIKEINTIRKHISLIKGGNLSKIVYPANMLCIVISDVIGDYIDVIGSGPTAPDKSTFKDSCKIIEKYKIKEKIPKSIKKHLLKGCRGEISENPKNNDKIFDRVNNFIIANNKIAINECIRKAISLGYNTKIIGSSLSNSTKHTAKKFIDFYKKIENGTIPLKKPAFIIAGGEPYVKVKGNGIGGRNQELALEFAIKSKDIKNVVFMSLGTDGTDGPTDAAGAVVSYETLDEAKKMNIDPISYLKNNDSNTFFNKVGGIIETGPTNTNVMDIMIMIVF